MLYYDMWVPEAPHPATINFYPDVEQARGANNLLWGRSWLIAIRSAWKACSGNNLILQNHS